MGDQTELMMVGYWSGPQANLSLPSVLDYVDPEWDIDERDSVASYVSSGTIAAACMGYSLCRMCGQQNGTLDYTDGVFVWPEGLAHYIEEHSVRLPARFVTHAIAILDSLEGARRSDTWWLTQALRGREAAE